MIPEKLIDDRTWAVARPLHTTDRGDRDFELVWLVGKEDLNTTCENFLIFGVFYLNFLYLNSLKYCFSLSKMCIIRFVMQAHYTFYDKLF